MVERANGFRETSFMPGRSFASPGDYNTQLAGWLPRANTRILRRTGEQPGIRIAEDAAAMRALPPVAPAVGITTRVRLGRDYYVRVAGNDYSVDPHVIGRFVDVHAGLDQVAVTCAGILVASHQQCWATHQNITDPAHVVAAAELRTAYQARTAATRAPRTATGTGFKVGNAPHLRLDRFYAPGDPLANDVARWGWRTCRDSIPRWTSRGTATVCFR